MSTDFTTGRNVSISNNDLYLLASDKIATLLGVDRSDLYAFYKRTGRCSGNGDFGYYDRYMKVSNSNDYTGNPLDDIYVLAAAVDQEIMLDKAPSSITVRRDFIMDKCSGLIAEGLCDDFTLTGCFPHLDMPDGINSFAISGEIRCIDKENPYGVVHAKIGYTDSCGVGVIEPVPYYPLDMPVSALMEKDTLEDSKYGLSGVEYRWVLDNPDDIVVSEATSSMTCDHIDVATSRTAISYTVVVSLVYTER